MDEIRYVMVGRGTSRLFSRRFLIGLPSRGWLYKREIISFFWDINQDGSFQDSSQRLKKNSLHSLDFQIKHAIRKSRGTIFLINTNTMGLDIARQMESCVGGLHRVIDSWAADPIIDYFLRGIQHYSDGL